MNQALQRPINRTAAAVVSKGVAYTSPKRLAQLHWESPPNTLPLMQGMPDLTGRKCGLMTVIGLFARSNGKGNSKWLVRCPCGHYETRKSSRITGARDPEDCCQLCRQLEFTKRHQYWREHGYDKPRGDNR